MTLSTLKEEILAEFDEKFVGDEHPPKRIKGESDEAYRDILEGYECMMEARTFLSQAIDRATKEAIEAVLPEEVDTLCESGECKIVSYPICRNKQGKNDARTQMELLAKAYMEGIK